MHIILAVLAGMFGAAFGSFLNVCIDRLPAGTSLVKPPSHCDACQRRLTARDMVPILSYIFLRGRCSACHAAIPRRVLYVELATTAIFALTYLSFGVSLASAVLTLYFMLLVVVLFIDLEHQLILNKVVYPAAIGVILIDLMLPQFGVTGIPQAGLLGLPGYLGGLPSGIIGAAAGFTFLLIPALIHPAGMGWGDVKFAGLMGLMLGFANVLVALMLGIVLGGLTAVALLTLRRKTRREQIPFGPFLAIGTGITLIWGAPLLDWYLRFFLPA